MRTLNNMYTRLPNRQNPPFLIISYFTSFEIIPIIPETTDERTRKTFMNTSTPQIGQNDFSKDDATIRVADRRDDFDRYH